MTRYYGQEKSEEDIIKLIKEKSTNILNFEYLTPKLKEIISELTNPLWIQLHNDMNILGFDFKKRFPNNSKYYIEPWVVDNIMCMHKYDIKYHFYVIKYLHIEEFYPKFKEYFKKELRATKLKQII